jgi:hypothetical protein
MQEHFPETKFSEVVAEVKQSRIAEWMQIHGTAILGGAISILVAVLVLVPIVKLIGKARRMLRIRRPALPKQEKQRLRRLFEQNIQDKKIEELPLSAEEQQQFDVFTKNVHDIQGLEMIAARFNDDEQKGARATLDNILGITEYEASSEEKAQLCSALRIILGLEKAASDTLTAKAWKHAQEIYSAVDGEKKENIADAFDGIDILHKLCKIYERACLEEWVMGLWLIYQSQKAYSSILSAEEQKQFDVFTKNVHDIQGLEMIAARFDDDEQKGARDTLNNVLGITEYEASSEEKAKLRSTLRRIFGLEEAVSDTLTARVFKHIKEVLPALAKNDRDEDVIEAFKEIDVIYEQANLRPSTTKPQTIQEPPLSEEEQKQFDAFMQGLHDIGNLRVMANRLKNNEQREAKAILRKIQVSNYKPGLEEKAKLCSALRIILDLEEAASNTLTAKAWKHAQEIYSAVDEEKKENIADAFDGIDILHKLCKIYERACLKEWMIGSLQIHQSQKAYMSVLSKEEEQQWFDACKRYPRDMQVLHATLGSVLYKVLDLWESVGGNAWSMPKRHFLLQRQRTR